MEGRALSVLLGGLWLFVFNDGALCWGFPHFLPLIVLIPRGRGGTGSGLGGLYGTSKAADDFPNSSRMSSHWKQARAQCVVSIRREQERQIATKAQGMALVQGSQTCTRRKHFLGDRWRKRHFQMDAAVAE